MCFASLFAFSACNKDEGDPIAPKEPIVSKNNFYVNPIFPIVEGERKAPIKRILI